MAVGSGETPTAAQRSGNVSESYLSACVAASVTIVTLASASYLFYARCQRLRGTRDDRPCPPPDGADGTACSRSNASGLDPGDTSHSPGGVDPLEMGREGDAIEGDSAARTARPAVSLRACSATAATLASASGPTDIPSGPLSSLLGGLWGLWRTGPPMCAAHAVAARGASAPGSQDRHLRGAGGDGALGAVPGSGNHDGDGNGDGAHGAAAAAAVGPDTAPAGRQDQGWQREPGLAGGGPGGELGPDAGDGAGREAEPEEAGGEGGEEERDGWADAADASADGEEAEGHVPWRELLEGAEDELEVPEEYRDPISLNVMLDPVVLCATGQVYDYSSLRNWFRTGNRLCPKTNIEVLDVQVVRLPWLKARIHEWLRQHGRDPQPPPDPVDRLARLHPTLAGWVCAVRSGSGEARSAALADLYELLRQWEAATVAAGEAAGDGDGEGGEAAAAGPGSAGFAAAMERLHTYVRGAVMDEATWLLRYGNPYLQGVAASILAYCDTPGEVSWLAAVAAVPATQLASSANRYTSQAATRLLYNLARGGPVARRALVGAGAVTALIAVLATDRQEYGYCRDRAAATLALLLREPDGRSLLLRYGVPHLAAMATSGADRWEQRDAATVLLKLGLEQGELRGLGLTPEALFRYWCCSRAWLEGRVDDPTSGYGPAEQQARHAVTQLSSGGLAGEALAAFLSQQDADLELELGAQLGEPDDPWAEGAHATESAACAWSAAEAYARCHLAEAANSTLAERQAAEEQRRRRSVGAAGSEAAEAEAAEEEAGQGQEGSEEEEEDVGEPGEGAGAGEEAAMEAAGSGSAELE